MGDEPSYPVEYVVIDIKGDQVSRGGAVRVGRRDEGVHRGEEVLRGPGDDLGGRRPPTSPPRTVGGAVGRLGGGPGRSRPRGVRAAGTSGVGAAPGRSPPATIPEEPAPSRPPPRRTAGEGPEGAQEHPVI